MRLCLPHILRHTLSRFHYGQICRGVEELQIHCAPCTPAQLLALKDAGVLPLSVHQCGLITRTDAERLTSYLIQQQQQHANDIINSRSANVYSCMRFRAVGL